MTINDRLFARGLMSRFVTAGRSANRDEMIAVLLLIALTEEQATTSTTEILANPARYGF